MSLPSATHACPACGAAGATVLLQMERVPVFCNVLWGSKAAAQAAAMGSIRLAHCPACDMVYNTAFDPELIRYGGAYENALHFSPRFRQYARELTGELVERCGLRGRSIVEIGCGDGQFLAALCEAGGNRGVGFDPAHDPAHAVRAEGMRIVAEAFGPEAKVQGGVDLVCCRHVLEHIPRPLEFLRMVRETIPGGRERWVFFEVPNGLFVLQGGLGVWDVIYEHCSYFTPASLAAALAAAGFTVEQVMPRFAGQYLTILAHPSVEGESPLGSQPPALGASSLTKVFAHAYARSVEHWRERLAQAQRTNARVVIWGAGSKGVSFLNALGDRSSAISFAVDVNPRKHGKFIAGTGQEVVAPEFLKRLRPEVVVGMNPMYREEIERELSRLGVRAELWSS